MTRKQEISGIDSAAPRNSPPPPGDRTTIYLSDTDCHMLTTLQERYGLPTMSAALRYAVRRLHERQEQQTLLTEQLTSLRRELAQSHDEIAALCREREFMLKEMQILNEELLQCGAVKASLLLRSSSERAILRQHEEEENERDAMRRVRIRAQQVRRKITLHWQYWDEKVKQMTAQTYSIMAQSCAIIQQSVTQQKEGC